MHYQPTPTPPRATITPQQENIRTQILQATNQASQIMRDLVDAKARKPAPNLLIRELEDDHARACEITDALIVQWNLSFFPNHNHN
jgi:hypothetical protein